MELLSDVGHVESPFGPFGDNVSVGDMGKCIIASEIIL
jgi:hypothetical protein